MWYKVVLITALVGLVTIPASLLTALFVGEVAAVAVLVVGWFFFVPVIPLLVALYRTMDSTGRRESEQDALGELKRGYAKGEISEAEFVDRVERLIEVEELERNQTLDSSAGDGRDRTAVEPDDRDQGHVLERES